MQQYLPVANSFDVVAPTLTDANTGAAVTDAALKFTLKDIDGATVAGCDGVTMTHQGEGTYRGRVTPTSDLADGASYECIIASSAYTLKWDWWLTALKRNPEM